MVRLLVGHGLLSAGAWLGTMAEGYFFLLILLNAQVNVLELMCCLSNRQKPRATNHGLLQLERALVVEPSCKVHVAVSAGNLPMRQLSVKLREQLGALLQLI